ncbi:MAG: adenylate kinase [Flavobacteriaceae bacterium]|jgi:adenylate kinase|nr:adenylate kinase [Flavobacteriaceae bacterium]
MIAIVLFGKPGAGKGTQAEFLKEKYNLTHISTGDVFRFNIKNGTELGVLAQQYITKGELVPDSVTIDMLAAEVENNMTSAGFLFDGFPRTIAQAEALEQLLNEKGINFVGTIGIDANDDILVERILERGKTSGRPDDQDENKIRNRYTEYNEKTAPLIDFYTKAGKYSAVDGIGAIEEVTARLNAVIDRLL